ncbi:hypothetical protein N7495_008976 [Penicillium taxi]|uniref:uncharacterized protein n=1 Tax=Penicillium taxi TaxID=168475 RepID=UPI002544DBB2|nr:uncharacterized protein N7495_008976 [Penicillium taxi]KAJ5888935.1 hypothetical protein N7495_008976 [Penicillium taxi]
MDNRVDATLSDISTETSDFSEGAVTDRPNPPRFGSGASFDSLQRHRRRSPRARRQVKETLDARSQYTTSQDDGTAEHRINQYVIKQEIGRGSFGAVHLAADQYGNEYAVKEFSKSRLRKRAQSHMLRRLRGPRRPGSGFNSPMHRHPSGDDNESAKNPLYLIKEEIAIMKKLNHNNLVSLIEVLDDPTEDPLYMADPYDDDHCRCWFRDLILGIEYLHAQGIVHRDIKPDNCLVTNDNVLKVVDFGVSEMFEKDSDMFTAKSAGSPAFLPPELCVIKHGDVSGKAADIWSMGVTLYCLRYGRLPFQQHSIFDLYESIRNDPVECTDEHDEHFKDLISRILDKNPAKRIEMRQLREHPWVTKNGADPLLSEEENTAHSVEPPTEEEMNAAITKKMGNLMTVMKAVKKFKRLVEVSKSGSKMQSILGGDANFVQPIYMDSNEYFPEVGLAQSSTGSKPPKMLYEPERKASGSIHSRSPQPASPGFQSRASSVTTKRSVEGTRGHAKDPLEEDFPYLFIGPSTYNGEESSDNTSKDSEPIFAEPEITEEVDMDSDDPVQFVSESPGAAEFDIYETAYRRELERISQASDTGQTVYLTRRVEKKDEVMNFAKNKAIDLQIGTKRVISASAVKPTSGLCAAVSMLQSQIEPKNDSTLERRKEEFLAARHDHIPSSSISSQFLPSPKTSTLEATGAPVIDSQDTSAQLRHILGHSSDGSEQ